MTAAVTLAAGTGFVAAYGAGTTSQMLAMLTQMAIDAHKHGKNDCPPKNGLGNQPMMGMAKKPDINQIAKQFNMTPEQRRDFGDYIEDLKRNSGRGPSDNFSWQELRSFAEDFIIEE